MADPETGEAGRDLESEILDAIAAFEQILEAMPNDRASLETLSHAYQQIGDHTRAREYLVRLGRMLREQRDVESARLLEDRLRAFGGDPECEAILDWIAASTAEAERGPAPDGSPAVAVSAPGSRVAESLSFAWNLLQAGQLTQEEYATVVQDLTELSAADSGVPLSVLHVLKDRGLPSLERILAYSSRDCNMPVVSLSSFDLAGDVSLVLPAKEAAARGAIVFGFLGDEALVAVLNPYDQPLRREIEARLGRTCHFYLTHPGEFDGAIEKIREAQSKSAEAR